MYGWFQKFFKSRVALPAQHEQEAGVTKHLTPSASRASSPLSSTSLSLSSSSGSSPQQRFVLNSDVRWEKKYDVFVCHSDTDSDIEEATCLVSFLEASPCCLRCFLWQRDASPGAAVFSEVCQAVQDSHLRVLLITPSFLQDDRCNYMMQQALAEGPMSNRLIPLIQNLHHSQYPLELKYCYYIDLSKNPNGYTLVNTTVLHYLEALTKKEMIHGCSMDGSSSD
ncbi:toll/interleukin-1 receptor domain-containing adapter protein [Parambassis ranga]|uniref:Toll/interleukin-1 receptor domain-containing adapter protein n=1 Tax=Parambassis ranga TaxID=210632 RepID=A0A6P7JK57_9TELE|nr:toll/interleukin-1 receptor domain-containing adapter protein [Parambassis ranga]